MIHEYANLSGRNYWNSAITNDGSKVILCGRNVRLYDCNTQRFLQTINKTNNAVVALSHSQNTACFVNACVKEIVTVIECAYENGLFVEKKRIRIKGMNADGGQPRFSCNDKYLFFATQSKKLWRYTCETGECTCIYQPEYPDQILSFDIYEDQILIVLNSSTVIQHNGFEILSVDGSSIKSLRYSDNKDILNILMKAVWLNKNEIMAIYPLQMPSPFDSFQKILWQTSETIHLDLAQIMIPNQSRILFTPSISQNRRYIVLKWLNWQKGGDNIIQIYSTKDMERIHEISVNSLPDIAFSENEKYCFICAEPYRRLDL